MPAKELGPLATVQNDANAIKNKVESLLKECSKTIDNKKLANKDETYKDLHQRCTECEAEVTPLLEKARELTRENEPSKVMRFDGKKTSEIKRLENWQTRLKQNIEKVAPEVPEPQEEEVEKKEDDDEDDLEADEEPDDDDLEDVEDVDDSEKTENKPQSSKRGKSIESSKKVPEESDEDEDDDDEEEEDEEAVDEEEDDDQGPAQTDEVDNAVIKKTSKKVEQKQPESEDDDEDDADDEEVDDDEEEDEDVEEEGEEEDVSDEEDVDDEYEDEEEEEEETKAQREETEAAVNQQFVGLADFVGEMKTDLSFKKGEILTVVKTRKDGWWEAVNEKGEKGVVPRTRLQLHNKYKDLQQDDDDEEAVEQHDDGEDEDEEDEADNVERKVIPKKRRSGKELWGGIRKVVSETSVTDVLHAIGAGPSGFRATTLGKSFIEGETYTMKNYLTPKLTTSSLGYKDLFFNPPLGKIRARTARIQRVVTLQACRQIPLPGSGIEVLQRHVRVCLFDGQNILSNIHTIKVASVDREQRTWSFNTRINDTMDPQFHAEFFIRTSNNSPNLGILFELGQCYVKTSNQVYGEVSCGWVHLPLIDENGIILSNKAYDQYVHGGTPYEHGVEVDPSVSRRASSNALMTLISGNKQPRLLVKITASKPEQKAQLDTLSDTLVGNMCLLPYYSFYRQILADTLLRDRLDLNSTESIHSPFLTTFLEVADHQDTMRQLRLAYMDKIKTVKRGDRRDDEHMKTVFLETFMETVFPIASSATLPAYSTGDVQIQNARALELTKFQRLRTEKNRALAALLSPDFTFTPLDIKDIAFNVIGPNCLYKQLQSQEVHS